MSELVGDGYPIAAPVPGGRLRRNWIVRVAHPLPPDSIVASLEATLANEASATMVAAYGEVSNTAQLMSARPVVALLRLDDEHLVVRIEFADHEHAVGDSAAISQWGVLQSLDREIEIADLQGIPRRFWFPLRSTRV